MYSPGSLNFAVVVAVPLNTAGGGGLNSAFSTGGRALSNITVPGPRNLLQVMFTGAPMARTARVDFASSASHNAIGSGFESVAVKSLLCPRGPCTNGPLSENAMKGGVLPLASLNG